MSRNHSYEFYNVEGLHKAKDKRYEKLFMDGDIQRLWEHFNDDRRPWRTKRGERDGSTKRRGVVKRHQACSIDSGKKERRKEQNPTRRTSKHSTKNSRMPF